MGKFVSFVMTVFAIALAILTVMIDSELFFGRNNVLSGHLPSQITAAARSSRVNPKQRIELLLALNLRNETDLDELIKRQGDRTSTDFRRFISAEDFKRDYSPTQAAVDALVLELNLRAIKVLSVSDNRTLIHVEGSISQFENLFKVRIHRYKLKGDWHYSNDREPSLPGSFVGLVNGISGLNDFSPYRNKKREHAVVLGTKPKGLSPQNIATVYDLPNALNKGTKLSELSGKGVTLAIASAYSYDKNDVETFWRTYGIKRSGTVSNVHVAGVSTRLDDETTLDLQQAGAQAPGADIIMYLAKSPDAPQFTLTFNQIVADNKADIVSISWGACELETGKGQMQIENRIYKQGAAQGMAFFAASGDDGAYDCARGDKLLNVDYPSSDYHITAVGGTALRLTPDGQRLSEVVWTGGGGGSSTLWKRQDWQSGPTISPGPMRHSADVAMVSDPATGYATYFKGRWSVSGGTSYAAPNWAALWALAQEACGARLGPANPTLYRLGNSSEYAKTFHDIQKGNNGNGKGPGLKAGKDWDHPTGWGVPKGQSLIDWLKTDLAKSN